MAFKGAVSLGRCREQAAGEGGCWGVGAWGQGPEAEIGVLMGRGDVTDNCAAGLGVQTLVSSTGYGCPCKNNIIIPRTHTATQIICAQPDPHTHTDTHSTHT